ncbi:MAG TPA: PD-(D/E)XK nuclease family protein [Vicinamibacterales bacterium]|nr:PD-(D/E)XK nuclease family protein [Vicinamibacterales bacterium]
MPDVRVISSPAAEVRLRAVHDVLIGAAAGQRTLLVAPTRAAADECAAAAAVARGGLFGVTRTSVVELVMRLALPRLARQHVAPTTAIGAEAVVARARFEAMEAGLLRYFAPVADTPGFPRAAARTLNELQMAGVAADLLDALDDAGADLATLLTRLQREEQKAGTVSRAGLWQAATAALAEDRSIDRATAVVLLDTTIASRAEERFIGALLEHTSGATVTVPSGDRRTLAALARMGASVTETSVSAAPAKGRARKTAAPRALARLQQFLFSPDNPPTGEIDDSVTLFSAPGEGREAVEVARRVLAEGERGVSFDDIAILLRAPQTYLGLLEHALARAGVPSWFERGTRRPDPAGRAFLALLACADEQLSARRFAEYLSLAQVPAAALHVNHEASIPNPENLENPANLWSPPTDELASGLIRDDERAEDPAPEAEAPAPDERDGSRIVAGSLRAPWRWEELLVEAYVIQGLDRWQRRLRGLANEYELRLRELRDEDEDSPRAAAIERDRQELRHLEDFALPIVEVLDTWRTPRVWGEWLQAFESLVPRVLRKPARVLRVLTEMMPLGAIGPVSLAEVRAVLSPRLLTLNNEPARRRQGAVFIGTPASARGRAFRVVFVPGLAERVFPQRLREDALLLDRRRRAVDPQLAVADTRADEERLQLCMAVGAATERVHLSYPRIELGESRPRVPSFYVLEVMRAVTGSIPRYADLAEHAAREGGASLAWPAPANADRAIDTFEHDLAVLLPLLKERSRKAAEGRARYLIQLNDGLRRSVTERWARWQPRWHTSDGIIRVTADTQAALDAQRLTNRPYSLTALQRFAACPYQFVLAAIYRLAPLEEPAPLQYLDPLTKGSLFHAIQTEFLRVLQKNGQLPLDDARLPAARGELRWAIARVTDEARDKLAPAIERVWRDEIEAMSRDLNRWLEQLVADGRTWVPERFELAFGMAADSQRDAASTSEPARVSDRFLLRGSIDLVERRPRTKIVRVTDHKTGKNRTTLATIVDGGKVLQPVLYGLALESLTGDMVEEGRLSFCTTAGGFSQHPIPLDVLTRRRGVEVLEIIDRAIERGTLAARPARDACRWCDFRPVCGPDEEHRTLRKPTQLLADLDALRKMP